MGRYNRWCRHYRHLGLEIGIKTCGFWAIDIRIYLVGTMSQERHENLLIISCKTGVNEPLVGWGGW